MRVLVVGSAIDRVESAVFRALHGRGIDISIVCAEDSPFQDELRGAGIALDHRSIGSKFDLGASRYIRARLSKEGFNAVYALTARALTTTLWGSRGFTVPVVAYRGTVGHLSRLDPTSYLGFLNRRIATIVCVSRAVEDYLRSKGVPPERLVTIYKGHAAEWYDGQPAVHLGQFGVPAGVPVVACTANMRPVKGVDVLIEAFQFVQAQTEAHLLLIGEVRDARLERLVERFGLGKRVHFTGYRTDAPSIVRSCDVFVMPSRAREGLPKAVLEAMAQGVPPVVSAVGGLPEVVNDGVSGLVVPPAQPRLLAEAVVRLVSDIQLRTMLSRGARATVAGDFSIERTVERMRRVFYAVSGRPTA